MAKSRAGVEPFLQLVSVMPSRMAGLAQSTASTPLSPRSREASSPGSVATVAAPVRSAISARSPVATAAPSTGTVAGRVPQMPSSPSFTGQLTPMPATTPVPVPANRLSPTPNPAGRFTPTPTTPPARGRTVPIPTCPTPGSVTTTPSVSTPSRGGPRRGGNPLLPVLGQIAGQVIAGVVIDQVGRAVAAAQAPSPAPATTTTAPSPQLPPPAPTATTAAPPPASTTASAPPAAPWTPSAPPRPHPAPGHAPTAATTPGPGRARIPTGPVQVTSPASSPILDASYQLFHRWRNDCSGYVKAVEQRLGIAGVHQGMANAIVRSLWASEGGWERLATAEAAQAAANSGRVVVVGLENPTGHGHLALVLPGGPTPGGFCLTAWGSMTPGSAQHPWVEGRWVGLDLTWDCAIHPWLVFAAFRVPPTCAPPTTLPPGARIPPNNQPPGPPQPPTHGKAKAAADRFRAVESRLKSLGFTADREGLAQFQSRYMGLSGKILGILGPRTHAALLSSH